MKVGKNILTITQKYWLGLLAFFIACETDNQVNDTNLLTIDSTGLKTAFLQEMKTQHFVFRSVNNANMITVSPLAAKDASSRKAYNIQKWIDNDSTKVRFRVISMGCLEFIGNVKSTQDTLLLNFQNISNKPCECCQQYELEFVLPVKHYPQKNILLNNKPINK
jgi:hypothetical protein